VPAPAQSAQRLAPEPCLQLGKRNAIDRHRLVRRRDDAPEMAEHLLHEVDRLQLRRVATHQNWIA
jgi:hypothetical protein